MASLTRRLYPDVRGRERPGDNGNAHRWPTKPGGRHRVTSVLKENLRYVDVLDVRLSRQHRLSGRLDAGAWDRVECRRPVVESVLDSDHGVKRTRLHTSDYNRTDENTSHPAPLVVDAGVDPLAGAPGRNAVANDESSAVTASSASRAAGLGLVSTRVVRGSDSRLLN